MVVAVVAIAWAGGCWGGDVGEADRSVCGAGGRKGCVVGCEECREVHERAVIEAAVIGWCIWFCWRGFRWRFGSFVGGFESNFGIERGRIADRLSA